MMNLLVVARSLHFYRFALHPKSRALSVLHGRYFCGISLQLSTKKCVSCDSNELRPMTEESANQLLPKVEGWILAKEGEGLKLSRSWNMKSFTEGLEFFTLVGDVAEAEGHHPDLHLVGWKNVTIDIWTHAVDQWAGTARPAEAKRLKP